MSAAGSLMEFSSFIPAFRGRQWLQSLPVLAPPLCVRSGQSLTTAAPETITTRRHSCHPRRETFPRSRTFQPPIPSIPTSRSRPTGTTPDFPGIGRNSFRGPRYQDIDLTVAKEIGLPTTKIFGEGAKIELRMTAYNTFNKLNLAPFSFGSTSTTISSNNHGGVPFANPLFGTATSGLAGRVLELQARFSF